MSNEKKEEKNNIFPGGGKLIGSRIALTCMLLTVSVLSPLLNVRAEEPEEIVVETPEDENTGNEDSAETPKTDDVEKAEDPADTLPEDLKTGDVDEEEPAETPKTGDVENKEDPTETLPEDPETDDVEIVEPTEIVMQSQIMVTADRSYNYDSDTKTLTITGNNSIWDEISQTVDTEDIKAIEINDFTFQNGPGTPYEFGEVLKALNVEEIYFNNVNTSAMWNMAHMFGDCSYLNSLDLSSFNTGNVTRMSIMFKNCNSLGKLDLSSFDTSKVTTMEGMFSGCSYLEGVNLSSFVINAGTITTDMFTGCKVLSLIKAPQTIAAGVTVELPGTFEDEYGNEYTVLSKDCAGKTLTKKGTGGGGNTGDTGSDNTGETGSENTGDTGSGNTENTGSNNESSGNTSNTGSNSESSGNTSNAGSNSGNTGNNGNGNGNATQNTGSGSGTGQTTTTVLLPIQYTVGNGDTLGSIASKSGISLEWILAWNPQIQNPNRIYPGQVIILGYTEVSMNAAGTTVSETVETPVSEEEAYYIVQKGDCLYRIAVNNGVSFKSVLSLNPELVKQKYIYAGQKVRLK